MKQSIKRLLAVSGVLLMFVCQQKLNFETSMQRWEQTNSTSMNKAESLQLHYILEAGKTMEEQTQKTQEDPAQQLQLHAGAAVLMDGYTGRILYEKNASQVLPMASTTKIMTAILALENGDPQETVEVSPYAASMPDVQLGIQAGETYRLQDLLYSLMLESHNDSAVAIAEHVGAKMLAKEGGKETEASRRSVEESKELVAAFAKRMNEKAKEIGCEKTCFVTPNGLDGSIVLKDVQGKEETRIHSTTAAELALIMRYCLVESACAQEFIKLTQTREVSFSSLSGKRSFSCNNHNRYLDMREGAISGKTGFTGKAGYCYVGAVNQDGVFLIAALLACGWPPAKTLKWKDMNTLVDYGMENYSCVSIQSLEDPGFTYALPIENSRGRIIRWQPVKTMVRFTPFSCLLKKGEQLSGSWYIQNLQKGQTRTSGEEAGRFFLKVGDVLCRSFVIEEVLQE